MTADPAQPGRILICDDTDMIRSLLRAVVNRSDGLQVVGEASNGNEALVVAKRLQPDVILLDLAMPNLSGLDALPELRRLAPEARIIVFSGFASSHVAEHVLALGATSYLQKGASKEIIVETIRHALAIAPADAAPAETDTQPSPIEAPLPTPGTFPAKRDDHPEDIPPLTQALPATP